MRTSLNDIKYIEGYLTGQFSLDECKAFDVRLRNDYHFRVNISIQKKIYSLLSLYKKRKLKQEVEKIHQRLFHGTENTAFQKTIRQFFNQ